jgi:hypothetical protein
LGRRVAGGSPWRACGGDGGRAEGCASEGVGRLSLAWSVRSVSTSELGRRYWRGRRDWRSTGGGGRRWPVVALDGKAALANEGGGQLGASRVLAEGSGSERTNAGH